MWKVWRLFACPRKQGEGGRRPNCRCEEDCRRLCDREPVCARTNFGRAHLRGKRVTYHRESACHHSYYYKDIFHHLTAFISPLVSPLVVRCKLNAWQPVNVLPDLSLCFYCQVLTRKIRCGICMLTGTSMALQCLFNGYVAIALIPRMPSISVCLAPKNLHQELHWAPGVFHGTPSDTSVLERGNQEENVLG